MNPPHSFASPFRALSLAGSCAALAFLLSACGGGADDETDAASQPAQAAGEVPSEPTATATATPSSSPSTTADGPLASLPPAESAESAESAEASPDEEPPEAQAGRAQALSTTSTSTSTTCSLTNFQAAVLARINQYRAAGASCRTAGNFAPTQSLLWNSKLQQAAAGHSLDMARNNFFSHTSPSGSTMVSRVNATGYLWSSLGENIAAGQTTVNAVVDGWMASDGHCRNLMNPNLREVGAACVASSTSRYRTYWTLDLARPR